MRMSQLFGKTLRQPPAEAETPSHRLLLRAGLIHQIAAGVYAFLPLAWRALHNVERIIREEMNAAGGQELMLPAIHPIEIWQASGRDQTMKDILFRFSDKRNREFVLGPTHEEVIVELFKRNVHSYRDLPLLVYQIQQKFRDEPRPRGGLIRLRQFTMKDLYSFDTDFEGLDVSYRKMYEAYTRIFDRCGVPTVPALADSGAMGGRDTHEFIYLTEYGEDTCLLCPKCGYAANAEVAAFVKEPAHNTEEPKPIEEIPTPGLYTIQSLADHLGLPTSKTCKAVFYSADGEPVFVAIRGDMDVNESKLRHALGTIDLHYMSEDEVAAAGFVPGSAGAVGLNERLPAAPRVRIIADDLLPQEVNLVAGANKPDAHLLNVNYSRDWQADTVADIALAGEGSLCAAPGHGESQCRTPMDLRRGIEMGQVFKLGTLYADLAKWEKGKQHLQQALAINPQFAPSYLALGALYNRQGQPKQAESALRKGLELAPDSWQGHSELSRILLAQSEVEQAVFHARRAHELQPEAPLLHVVLANIFLRQRDLQAALQEYRHFLELAPDAPAASQVEAKAQQIESALKKQSLSQPPPPQDPQP